MIIDSLTKSYGKHVVFENFSLNIKDNEITTILGPSGCGKTTLLRIISGLEEPDRPYLFDFKNKRIGYIFQESRLLPWRSAIENIRIPLESFYSKKEAQKLAKNYIKLVRLQGFENHFPRELSGGMQQRIAIARAFVCPSDILLMDEPFKGLDHGLKKELMELFIRIWSKDSKTVLFITHCREEAKFIGNNIIQLGKNNVCNSRSVKCI